jgi:hypothetical protein
MPEKTLWDILRANPNYELNKQLAPKAHAWLLLTDEKYREGCRQSILHVIALKRAAGLTSPQQPPNPRPGPFRGQRPGRDS